MKRKLIIAASLATAGAWAVAGTVMADDRGGRGMGMSGGRDGRPFLGGILLMVAAAAVVGVGVGLAMVVGCGAASDQAAYDDAGEFHVPRSIASAEPGRLNSDDRLAIDIAFADDGRAGGAKRRGQGVCHAREAQL